ncbi:MAG: glycosyltransferase, partial [Ilumatobacteraceae bacterium]
SFDDPAVGGVGGIVFDHSGMALQYRYSAANRFGEATASFDRPYDDFSVPGSFTFPYLQGTNALFRRSALEEIGGFDETYDYYLDETDVCCRLVDAGYILHQLPNAPVHHKFLPSTIRSPQRVVTNWFPIIKNFSYFAYRHALGMVPELDVIDRCRAFIDRWVADADFHEQAGRLPAGSVDRVRAVGAEAMARGMQLGRERHGLRLQPLTPPSTAFQPYPVVDSCARRRIAIVCGDYPPRMTGGIARFIGDLAPSLAESGHEVRVITRSDGHSTVDLEDGVWIHRLASELLDDGGAVPEALPHINAFVTASVDEIRRIGEWTSIDLVYGPAWDVDVIGALRMTPLPVIAMLATPVAVAAMHAGSLDSPEGAEVLGGLIRAEREVFAGADIVHSISAAVYETVRDKYNVRVDPARLEVAPIGLRDRAGLAAGSTKRRTKKTSVLFVGRLETRKGIDDFLAAIEVLAEAYPAVEWTLAGAETTPPGTSGREETFRKRNIEQGWTDRVVFLGAVDDEALDAAYRAADLVVLPSRYESFGLVMLEAMMHGKAVVSCDVGGIVEVVRDGVDGLLVAPADPVALARAIGELLDDPARRATMGRQGRKRFEQEFSIPAAMRRFQAMIERITLTSLDPNTVVHGPRVPIRTAGGTVGLLMSPRTRVVLPAHPTALRRAAFISSTDGTINVHVRATATTVRVGDQWTRVDLATGDDDTTLTCPSGNVTWGGVVEIAGQP